MSTKVPLLDDNIDHFFNELRTKSFQTMKYIKPLEDIIKNMDKYSKSEFNENKETFICTLEEEEDLYKDITELAERIANFKGNKNDIQDIQSKSVEIVAKNETYHRKIIEMKKTFENRAPLTHKSTEELSHQLSSRTSFQEEKLMVHNIQKNEEMLKNRREELEQAKQLSGQIKGITQEMKVQVFDQGNKLYQVEDHVCEIQENVNKAEKEIQHADRLSSDNRKKLIWLIAIIVFVVLSIVILSVLIAQPWKKD